MAGDLKGIITPVVTVFDDDENIDEKGYRKIITYLIDHGVYGIFACGGQGECYALSREEKLRIYDIALETVNGRIPVLLGSGANTTREAVALTRAAEKAGGNYATILNPYYISPNQDELYKHYVDIIDATDIPILIYNNPWRTHYNILPDTVARIYEYSQKLVGIKDSSGDLANSLAYKRLCGNEFKVFMGRDHLIFSGLASRLDGAVAATSNAAVDIVVGIYNEFIAKNFNAAMEYQKLLTPFREFWSRGSFPVVVKEAMNLQGLPAGQCRRPIRPISEENRNELKILLKKMGLL